jgi:hypothetical protein
MLRIRVGGTEAFDDATQSFVGQGGTILDLEHSLLSMSKWEAIFEKPFLGKEDKTAEEVVTYIRCMCVDPNVPPEVFQQLSEDNIKDINRHIESKESATWINEPPGPPTTRQAITSELIYYWMTQFQIPFEAERWHLNRLFTLIRICNIKQAKPKKMSRAEIAARNRELNAQRKRELNTTG